MEKTGLSWKIQESQRVIKATFKKWGKDIGVAFTGGKDSVVLVHMIKQVIEDIPELMFIDHGLHFKETRDFVNKIKNDWNLKVLYTADEKYLDKLRRESDLKKKRELARVLKIKTIEATIKKHGWRVLFVGIRWDEHPARSEEKYFSRRKDHWRVHPILHFKEQDIWNYIKSFKLPYNRLYDKGYRSIGEKAFTKPVFGKDASERSGREKDKEKIMERLRALGYF